MIERVSGAGGATVGGSEIFAPGLLQGQVALVTGGGTGLGRATAHELARCGAAGTIAGRRGEVLERAAGEIAAELGAGASSAAANSAGRVDSVSGDVREPGDA